VRREGARRAALALLAAAVAGCTAQRPLPPPPPEPAAVVLPAPEPRSPWGNGPVYEVHGRRYVVLETSRGYRERGIASWYGQEFHGKPTSSRETYDMYKMTAAHRTLPLPSWVRVTNLRNKKSVIVRVNDRGPFVAGRLIDLSYAAAEALDMIDDGTAPVEVTAIDFSAAPEATVAATDTALIDSPADTQLYLQVGAFGDLENARRRFEQLQRGGVGPAFVHEDVQARPALYRVRIGPIDDAEQYDALVARLRSLGISEMHLVTE
jgi:rare lipoprotein A